MKKQKGITLVALVITIIILLILAGISISALTNQGLFTQAQNAKNLTEEKTAEENEILTNYLDQMNAIIGGEQVVRVPLADKVNVGDYVSYKPDEVTTTEILEELSAYSGSTDNTSSTLTQETDLKWRVLDVENGKVRLISEVPTNSQVKLSGDNGYNNAVYLLDKTCRTLYSKAGYTENVQNLKIEDIQNKMSIDYKTLDSNYGTTLSPEFKKYPSILAQEEGQTITGITQPETRLKLSEQTTPINQTTTNTATSLSLKYTHWYKEILETYFTNPIYYNLFINNGSNNLVYWLSSRCVYGGTRAAGFGVSHINDGKIQAWGMSLSDGSQEGYTPCALRPVITLNSNVLVKLGEGTSTTPYEIDL